MFCGVTSWKQRSGIFSWGFCPGRVSCLVSSFQMRPASVELAGLDVTHPCSGHLKSFSQFQDSEFPHIWPFLLSFIHWASTHKPAMSCTWPWPWPWPGLAVRTFLELMVCTVPCALLRVQPCLVYLWMFTCSRRWHCYENSLESFCPSWMFSFCMLWCLGSWLASLQCFSQLPAHSCGPEHEDWDWGLRWESQQVSR